MADVSFDDKYRRLSRRALEWRRDLRDFLSPGRDPQHVNKEWVEDCLSRVSLVQAGAIASRELEEMTVAILSDLGRSLRWARRAADQHMVWMLRWCAVTVYEKRGDAARTLYMDAPDLPSSHFVVVGRQACSRTFGLSKRQCHCP